jgi:antitoxin CcdA
MQTATKKPTNLSLDQALLREAKAFGVNLSQAAEVGVKQAVAAAKSAHWMQENAQALQSSNAWVEQNGLPLKQYRNF